MLFHIKNGSSKNRTQNEAAKIVLQHIETFYAKANIPLVSEWYACQRLVKLVNENKKLRDIPVKRRSTPSVQSLVDKTKKDLEKTFKLWPENAEELIKNEQDRKFLQSMKSDRLATFGCFDMKLAQTVQRKEDKEEGMKKLREKEKAYLDNFERTISHSSTPDSDCDEEIASTSDVNFVRENGSKRKKTGTAAFVPNNILQSERLVSLATRMKMMPSQQAAYTEAVIDEIGGDSSKVCLSYAYADRARRHVSETITQNIKDSWIPPKLASLHWDSKLSPKLTNQNIKEERLVIALGDNDEIKILGTPCYKPGGEHKAGEIITQLTNDALTTWNCSNSVVNMVFDTTASNTGHVSAACVAIQKLLDRPLLWSGCRHHIGEIVVSHVFNDLKIEASKSPDTMLFVRLRKNWDKLQTSEIAEINLKPLDLAGFSQDNQTLILACRDEVTQNASSQLSFKRDDYKEFIELCLLFLQGNAEMSSKLRTPGALHKARWLAKNIYLIKIILMEDQIKKLARGTITTQQQVQKIRDMATFLTLVYSNWWLSCGNAVDAPHNDLQFIKQLIQYQSISSTISTIYGSWLER